jgi:dTMP kinase
LQKKGYLITFEGGEGAGKSTQIKRTAAYARSLGFKVKSLREPGGTTISEAIRNVLLDRKHHKMTPQTELLLYLAARAQIIAEKIKPAIEKGYVVICDRFEDSTLAYQGYGRGFKTREIKEVSKKFVRGNLQADLTVLLDIAPEKGLARGGRHDRMEQESLVFHRKIRKGFLTLAKQNRKRYLVLDATKSKNEITIEIKQRVSNVLK